MRQRRVWGSEGKKVEGPARVKNVWNLSDMNEEVGGKTRREKCRKGPKNLTRTQSIINQSRKNHAQGNGLVKKKKNG